MIDIERGQARVIARLSALPAEWAGRSLLAQAGRPRVTGSAAEGRQLTKAELLGNEWVLDLIRFATNVQNRVVGALDEQDYRWLFNLEPVSLEGHTRIIHPLTARMMASASAHPELSAVGTRRYDRKRVFETNAVFIYHVALADEAGAACDDLRLALELLAAGHLLCGARRVPDRAPVAADDILFY